ncbi:hypothetical protein B0H10DRAFT_1946311 [Mycena sp. CBHHK59/15]|nr:hypothetical protein B0H10DRAFT_1946311 [Mycena sp. CBHHK59/15]
MDPQKHFPQHEIDVTQQFPREVDLDAVLTARMNEMRLQYDEELRQFKSSLQAQFATATQQSQQSQMENERLRDELARLRVAQNNDIEMVEQPNTGGSGSAKRTRDPRPRPHPTQTPTKDPRTAPNSASPGARTTKPAPEPPQNPRRSHGTSSRSTSAPEVPRSSPNTSQSPPSTSAPEARFSS